MKNFHLAFFIALFLFISCKDNISDSSQNNDDHNSKYLEQNIDILKNSNGKIVEIE